MERLLSSSRYPFLLGAIQVVEADPTQADKVVGALHKFVALANTMLQNNGEGLEDWGKARWEEFVIVLQWCVCVKPSFLHSRCQTNVHRLYEFYPNGQEDTLLSMMQTLKATGDPWDAIFAPEVSMCPSAAVP